MTLKISVVVCTRDRCEELAHCLDALAAQELPPGDYEIIVVDNGSRDATRETVERALSRSPRHSIRYILEEMPGISAARNRGIVAARGGIVAFIDDDAVADSRWLTGLQEAYDLHGADAVGGRVDLVYPRPRPPWLGDGLEAWLSKLDLGWSVRRVRYPEELVGANMSYRKELLDGMGGFDTALGRKGRSLVSGEDSEMQWRAERGGAKVCYTPAARVQHRVAPERLSRRWYLRRAYSGGRSMIRVRLMFEGGGEALRELRSLARALLRNPLSGERRGFQYCVEGAILGGYLRESSALFLAPRTLLRHWRESRRRRALLRRLYRPAEVEGEIAVRFDARINGLTFLGYTLTGRSLKLFFRAESRVKNRYIIFFHIHPENCDILTDDRKPHGFFNRDHAPAVPTRRWRKGMVFIDEVDLGRLPQGVYTARFGLFDEKSGEKGRVDGPGGDDLRIETVELFPEPGLPGEKK